MRKRWLWGAIVTFFVLFSLTPTFYELSRYRDIRPERYFELVHNFYTDYNFYLSRIRQGREGAWTVQEKYTSEPHAGSLVQIAYLLMGKVSAWVGVPWPRSGDTYHAARAVLAFTLLFVVAYAAKTAFDRSRWQITAFLLAVTAASWPIPVFQKGEWRFGGYMPWWTIMDSLQRITFVPHMLAGQALIVFLILALTSETTMRRPGNWIFLGLLAFVLGIIFPPGLLFVGAVMGVYTGISGVNGLKEIKGRILAGLISAPSLLYLKLALSVYPWKRLVDYALLHPQPFVLKDYLLAVGPILPLGVIGGIWVIWKKEKRLFPYLAWAIAWFALIIVFGRIPQESPLRFTEMLPQLPLAFLSLFLLSTLRNWKRIPVALAAILVLVGLAQMYSSWRWQKEFIDQKIIATLPLVPTGSYVMYPLKDEIAAMIFIQDNTKRTDVVLSETTAGNYIPVYSGNTVYVGHANTVATEVKEQIVKEFFSGRMGAARAREFLATNAIRTVFFGPQEQEDAGVADLAAVYPFLREVYKNTYVRVYQW